MGKLRQGAGASKFLYMAVGIVIGVLFTSNAPQKSLIHSALLPEPTEDSSAAARSDLEVSQIPSFLEVASKTGTDKVRGSLFLKDCLVDPTTCRKPKAVNPKCRPGAQHFYDTLYQKWLTPLIEKNIQLVEIGFYNGKGFDAFSNFLPMAEKHSIEISCLPKGEVQDGKWPWGNFAERNKNYASFRSANRLHCGDAANYTFLHDIWTAQMDRPNAPKLTVVIDDGAHLAPHMAATLFFWFPRLQPGGILVVEDIEPQQPANQFRTGVLPQLMHDLHYCGDVGFPEKACFPTLQPLIHAIHCEMHICVFERNDQPARRDVSAEDSVPPPHALDATACLTGRL